MDFASALANLEKKAAAAANSQQQQPCRNNNNNERRRGRPPHEEHYGDRHRRSQRPRHHHHHHYRHQDDSNDRPLEALHRYGYRIAPFPTPSAPPPPPPHHIALLCICIDQVPYEDLWRKWAETGKSRVSFLVHAKYPHKINSPWVKQRLITKPPRLGRGHSYADPEYITHTPAWGSVQITRAMIDLLKQAIRMGTTSDRETDERFSTKRFLIVQDTDDDQFPPMVDKFIFCSETCIPVTTLAECEQAILPNYHQSWVNARNRNSPGTPKNKYERDQFNDIHRMIPQSFRYKSDQWLCLSRAHAAAVLDIDQHMPYRDQLWNSFAKINASDEMYFATSLALLGILTESDDNTQGVAKRPITYTDWTEGMRNPATFTKGIADVRKIAKLARQQGSLFARKFAPFIPIPDKEPEVTGQIDAEEWKDVMEELSHVVCIKTDQQSSGNKSEQQVQEEEITGRQNEGEDDRGDVDKQVADSNTIAQDDDDNKPPAESIE